MNQNIDDLKPVGTARLYNTVTKELTDYHLIFFDGEKNFVLCQSKSNPELLKTPELWLVLQGEEIPSDQICPHCVKMGEKIAEILKTMVDSSDSN